jgi:lipopolysaccharide biosynthesis regulator YciM
LDHALDVHPSEARYHYLRGSIALKKRQIKEALSSWQQAYKIDPEIFVTYATHVQEMLSGDKFEHLIAAGQTEDQELLQKLQEVKSGSAVQRVIQAAKVQAEIQKEEKKSLMQKLKSLFQ